MSIPPAANARIRIGLLVLLGAVLVALIPVFHHQFEDMDRKSTDALIASAAIVGTVGTVLAALATASAAFSARSAALEVQRISQTASLALAKQSMPRVTLIIFRDPDAGYVWTFGVSAQAHRNGIAKKAVIEWSLDGRRQREEIAHLQMEVLSKVDLGLAATVAATDVARHVSRATVTYESEDFADHRVRWRSEWTVTERSQRGKLSPFGDHEYPEDEWPILRGGEDATPVW